MKAEIKLIEYYLPERIETAETLKKEHPDWPVDKIEEKTGFKKRHIARPEETAVDMALMAAEKLFKSGIKKEEIDYIILVTQSGDYALPTSACIVQDRLGLKKSCMAFDVNLGCSGFVYGLAIAGSLTESGLVKKGLIICSETYTKYIDKSDRTCRPLFADGAAATLLSYSDCDSLGPFEMGTDGSGYRNLIVPSSGARISENGESRKNLFMDGAQVFMFTMESVPECVNKLLDKSGKKIDDIDLFVFHQASKVVLDNISRRLQIPQQKVFINYENVANTVSASIPIALKDAFNQKLLKKGDLIMLVGFGVGYSWGACLVRMGVAL